MPIVIVPPSSNAPAGKLADAELHFTTGPLAGLTLVGFSIWESQWPGKHPAHPHLRVTVPSREFTVGGEKRRFDLLRSTDPAVVDTLRDAILEAYAESLAPRRAPAPVTQRWVELPPEAPARPRRPQAPVGATRPAPATRTTPTRRSAPQQPRHAVEPPPHTDADYPF